jgi:hypothetical protein
MAKVGIQGVPSAWIENRVRSIVGEIDRRSILLILLVLVPLIAPIAAMFMLLDWWLAVLLAPVWLVLSELGMRRIGAAVARRAVRRFNREFPKGAVHRHAALQILAGLQCRHSGTVLKKMKAALDIPTDAFISTRPLPPESPVPPQDMPVPEFLPLDLNHKAANPPASASGVFLPIEPISKEAPASSAEGR